MYLVINLGLKSIRGIIFNENGKNVYSKSFYVKTHIKNSHVEQDPNEYKIYLEKILKNLNQKKFIKKIRYISTTTSASCLLLMSKKGNLLSKTLMVLDSRTKEYAKKLNNKINKNKFDIDDQALKILWFQKNSLYKNRSKYVLNSGDYLNYLFTKKIITDKLNYKKIYNNKYKIIEKLSKTKLSKNILFPKPLEIGSILEIDKFLIKKYNFNKDIKFILTTYDAICATIGSTNSTIPFHNISEVSGTVTSVRLITNKLPKIKNKKLKISPIPFLNIYIVGTSNNLGGGMIGWIKDFFLNKINFKTIEIYFKKAQNSFIILPFIFGDRYLGIDPSNGASLFGIKRNTTIHDFIKSCILSMGFMSQRYIDDLSSEGFKIKSITLSGGLSRLTFINKIKAYIFKKNTYVCKEFESTSYGCFLLMKAKIKNIEFKELIKIIYKKKIIIKNKKNFDYEYQIFKNTLKNFIKNKNKINKNQNNNLEVCL